MSRSRAKKYRILGTIKGMKRIANKKVRQNKLFVAKGALYKRLFESWDINDGGRAKPIPNTDEDWVKKSTRK